MQTSTTLASSSSTLIDKAVIHRHRQFPQLLRDRPISPGLTEPRALIRIEQDTLANTRKNVHFLGADVQPPTAVINLRIARRGGVNLPEDVEGDDERERQHGLEERLGLRLAANGPKCDVELGDQAQDVKAETDVAADDAEVGGEGQLVHAAAVVGPGAPEPDVRQTDAAPGEEVHDARESEQPVEHLRADIGGLVDEGEQREAELQDDGRDRTAVLVDVGEYSRSHALGGECLERAGGAEGARVGDRQDGYGDDGVEDRREALDAGHLDGDDERRRLGVAAGRAEEEVGVGGDDQADDEGVDDVEEEDAPEDLFRGPRKGLHRVRSFGGRKASQLRTAEGEGRGHEDGAEALEAVAERTRIVPVVRANVATRIGRNSTAVDNDTENDEAGAGQDLDDGQYKLDYTVLANSHG